VNQSKIAFFVGFPSYLCAKCVPEGQDSTVAAVALAWVHIRPGVSPTIIGARTMKQLDSNLAALDLPLSSEQIERLNKLSEPKLNFPAEFLKNSLSFAHAGATVNGVESTFLPFAPKDSDAHY
jgi:hypothetical protein